MIGQRTRRALASVAALCLVVTGCCGALAQGWLSRQITLVAISAPGAINDFVTRLLAQELGAAIDQTVVVENRSTAGGVAASLQVSKAPPDGHLFLVSAVGPAVLAPLMSSSAKYDALTDFTPVMLACETPNVLAASPKLGAKTVADVVAYGKAHPGKFAIGHPGIGTMGHLLGLLFASEAGIDANFVVYRGAAPMLADLIGGQIEMGFPAYGPGMDAVSVLAVTTPEPVALLPGVPTMAQSAFPKMVGATWYAVFAPPGLPEEIVAKVGAAWNAGLAKDDIRTRMQRSGCAPIGGSPERLRERIAADRGKWSEVIASAGIRTD